jgi:hypothetical protein
MTCTHICGEVHPFYSRKFLRIPVVKAAFPNSVHVTDTLKVRPALTDFKTTMFGYSVNRVLPMEICKHMKIARPVSALSKSCKMYCNGLGLEKIGGFTDHDGFSG